jgi:hypothetical protein
MNLAAAGWIAMTEVTESIEQHASPGLPSGSGDFVGSIRSWSPADDYPASRSFDRLL